MKFRIAIVLCLMIMVVTGCNRSKKPEGFPDVVKVSVVITQENAPLTDAQIELIPEDSAMDRWPVTGTTDASGKATLVTYGKFEGCPIGKYKVTVVKDDIDTKKVEVPEGVDPAEVKTAPGKIYSFVELKYTDPKKTTLEVTVEKGTKTVTLDVGKKVHEFKSNVLN